MFLKVCTGFSDAVLVEHLNGNLHYQFFCGVYIHPSHPLTSYKIVSAIRSELVGLPDVDSVQQGRLLETVPGESARLHDGYHVSRELFTLPNQLEIVTGERDVVTMYLILLCMKLGQRSPRNKYKDVSKRYLCYSKKRTRKQP